MEQFLFHVRDDLRVRPRYADANSANLLAISTDRKQKKFLSVNKIHMQNFSLLTSEIPDLEQFKAWNFFYIYKLFFPFLFAEIARKFAESVDAYRGHARRSLRT